MQQRLGTSKVVYHSEPFNVIKGDEQHIRISDGCPNNCPYCYAPTKLQVYPLPKITKNKVIILDMNLLCQDNALELIEYLGKIKVNNKIVYYDLKCGIDFRNLDIILARALKKSRFINIRFAWDYSLIDQIQMQNTLKRLDHVGYKRKEIMVFILANWLISYSECCKKLDSLKVWGVKADDNYFDGQCKKNPIIPTHWTHKEIKSFRKKVRYHNHLIIHDGIDPELK